jgi:hypothetical protein
MENVMDTEFRENTLRSLLIVAGYMGVTYALIDIARHKMRRLSKPAWVLICLGGALLGFVAFLAPDWAWELVWCVTVPSGAIAYLVLGRDSAKS